MNFKELSREVRKISGCSGKSFPITDADDNCQPPKFTGKPCHYINGRGEEVQSKHATFLSGGRRVLRQGHKYRKSTARITVGKVWCEAAKEFKPGTPWQMITDRALEMAGKESVLY